MGQYFPWVSSIGTMKTLSVEVSDPSDSQLIELLAVAVRVLLYRSMKFVRTGTTVLCVDFVLRQTFYIILYCKCMYGTFTMPTSYQ